CPRADSAKAVAPPTMAVSHIQNIAPGPPSEMARATPAMFAVPTRDAAEMEKARNGEMFRLPSASRPPGSTSVRNISGSSRTCTTPVRMVKYRPVGMRTATRMYDETVLTLSNTPWSISIELSLLRQSCCGDRRISTPSVVGYSLPPVTALCRRRPLPRGISGRATGPARGGGGNMQSAHWQDSRPVHPRIIGNLPATISLAAIADRDPAPHNRRSARIFAQIPQPPWRSPDMPITLVTPTAGPTPRRTVDPAAPNSADPSRTRVPPLVIAHRGASETWPENTI